MENKSSGNVISTLLFGSLIVMLIGAVFQLQHYPYGKFLFLIGIGTYVMLSLIEIDRLKKIIEKSADRDTKANY
jgi:hypothetical protein